MQDTIGPTTDVGAALGRLTRVSERWEARRQRAAARMGSATSGSVYFAVVGMKSEIRCHDLGAGVRLQEVVEPPEDVELASALQHQHLWGAIARYSQAITHELVVPCDRPLAEADSRICVGEWLIAALRVRSQAAFLVPAVSDYSWSTIPAVTEGTCHARLLEDAPAARHPDPPILVVDEHLEWVDTNAMSFADLMTKAPFSLAVRSLCYCPHLADWRMMVASLWSGIEALFGVQQELRFRLAALAAAVLEPPGEERRQLYLQVKRMYDTRSRVVHGAPATDDDLRKHIADARGLLSQLICTFTERAHIPTVTEMEARPFC